jgi:hypothetical protein
MPKKMSKETADGIARMYRDGASYKEIRKEFGCADITIKKVAERYALPPRRCGWSVDTAAEPTKKTNVEKICPKCRKPVEAHGARFCPWCGSDVRSERQIVAEELERVLGVVCDMNVPADSKDRACNTLRNAIRLLKEEAVE